MPTTVIFAHILSRARPMFGAEAAASAPTARSNRKHASNSQRTASKARAGSTAAGRARTTLVKKVNANNRRQWVNKR